MYGLKLDHETKRHMIRIQQNYKHIKKIKNPTDMLCFTALLIDQRAINYIKNPSIAVTNFAIELASK